MSMLFATVCGRYWPCYCLAFICYLIHIYYITFNIKGWKCWYYLSWSEMGGSRMRPPAAVTGASNLETSELTWSHRQLEDSRQPTKNYTMTTNIVTDWLRSQTMGLTDTRNLDVWRFLDLEEYSLGFLENGYDDLETVKLIEVADLEAIGVMRSDHQDYLLASVRILRERGAAWVYLIFSQPNTVSANNIEVLTVCHCHCMSLE